MSGGGGPTASRRGEPPRIFTPEYYRRMRDLEAHGWWNAGMRDVAGKLLDRVGLPERGTLVDAGCGTGQTMSWFRARRPEWRVVGADIAAEGLEVAREQGIGGVVLGDALALPMADRSADLVLTFDVLQHLPLDGGDARALAEIRRVLRPGGHLLLRTNAQAFPRTPDDPEHDFHRYRPGELRRKLEEAGFEVLRLSRINALLGLAEIPRALAARRREGEGGSYTGILAEPAGRPSVADRLKRAWLGIEGSLVAAGWRLPLGRSIVGLARLKG